MFRGHFSKTSVFIRENYEKLVRPEGLELSTFWFVAEQGQNLIACSGVAYESNGHRPVLRNDI